LASEPARNAVRAITTIPSTDRAFAAHVNALNSRFPETSPPDFERRLRTLFPRVVVRERSLSGEQVSWYVYRDGSWRPQTTGPWWLEENQPSMTLSEDGWIEHATRTASDLLGIADSDGLPPHFTDFVAPGALDDSMALLEIVNGGHDLEATVVLRPSTGELIAVELHATRDGDRLIARLRLADDVDIPAAQHAATAPPRLTFVPATDVAFRAYAQRALSRMPEATAAGLELRLRRLYPHATVSEKRGSWTVQRDREAGRKQTAKWWLQPGLAKVRYDAQGLILEADDAARQLFGRELAGHHWQDFVTPGSTEQVGVMLEIMAEVGAVESRFRMPRADGSLLEFDSYTEVTGDEFETVFRPVATRS
jgi:PAS domain-containing protein